MPFDEPLNVRQAMRGRRVTPLPFIVIDNSFMQSLLFDREYPFVRGRNCGSLAFLRLRSGLKPDN
jgi:hypothetical protein